MTTKGHIAKVFRENSIIHILPKWVLLMNLNDEPLAVKLYIFRGQYSRRVNDVELPIWFV